MFGYFLNWLQESETPKFIICTCNDVDALLSISQGAFIRRFDSIFYVDLPNMDEKIKIISIMNKKYGTEYDTSITQNMPDWSGAEIERCISDSLYDGIEVAMSNVHPIYQQNRAKIDAARDWAKDNTRLANNSREMMTKKGAIRRVR